MPQRQTKSFGIQNALARRLLNKSSRNISKSPAFAGLTGPSTGRTPFNPGAFHNQNPSGLTHLMPMQPSGVGGRGIIKADQSVRNISSPLPNHAMFKHAARRRGVGQKRAVTGKRFGLGGSLGGPYGPR